MSATHSRATRSVALLSAASVVLAPMTHALARTEEAPKYRPADSPPPTYRPADSPPPDYRPADAPPAGVDLASPKPVDVGSGGILTAEVLDWIGFGLVVLGGALAMDEDLLAEGLISMSLASVFLTTGGLVGTISYSRKQAAYADAGFEVRGGPRVTAWLLTALTTAGFVGSIALAAASLEDDGDGLGLGLASVGATFVAVLAETANWQLVRNGSWSEALDAAEHTESMSSLPVLVPTVGFARTSPYEAPIPTFGLAMRF